MTVQNIIAQNLGKFLQISYSEGIRNQISRDFRDWEYIGREKVADPMGRQVNFLFQLSHGPSAVQYRNPNDTSAFPAAQQITSQENIAVFKELDATIEIEYNLWKRAQMSGNVRYAEPLAVEIESKLVSLKRQMSKDLYGDGTGVLGTLPAAAAAVEGSNVRVQLDTASSARGHVGWFEFDEILQMIGSDGSTASALDFTTVGKPTYYKVVSRRRSDDTVLLEALNGSLVKIDLTGENVNTPAAAGEVLYKYGQPSFPNLGSVVDYGTVSDVFPGLESLTAEDGRKVHDITMQGSTAGTRYDVGNLQIDVTHVEQVMNDAKIATGRSQYAWKMACMAPETRSQFIEARETDRRFTTVEDSTRGTRKFAYMHEDDTIEFFSSEYCPKKRMYIIPEPKSGQGKVIEWHGTDFEPVRAPGGSESMLKSGASGYERKIVQYMEGYGTLICKHPAAVAVLENFRID